MSKYKLTTYYEHVRIRYDEDTDEWHCKPYKRGPKRNRTIIASSLKVAKAYIDKVKVRGETNA